MAVNLQIYSNANTSTKTIVFDFVGDVLAADYEDPSFSPTNTASMEYYFKITISAKQDDDSAYEAKVVRSLSELALNRAKQSQTDTAVAYADIKSMVIDYTYDLINGHTADQFSSGVTVQRPMKF